MFTSIPPFVSSPTRSKTKKNVRSNQPKDAQQGIRQITSVFCLYIWCAAADPADSGVFKSKKYLSIEDYRKHAMLKDSKLEAESTSSMHDANATKISKKSLDEGVGMESIGEDSTEIGKKNMCSHHPPFYMVLFGCCPPLYFNRQGVFSSHDFLFKVYQNDPKDELLYHYLVLYVAKKNKGSGIEISGAPTFFNARNFLPSFISPSL